MFEPCQVDRTGSERSLTRGRGPSGESQARCGIRSGRIVQGYERAR